LLYFLLLYDGGFDFFLVQEKIKRATVGPLPGVTQDIAGFKVKFSSAVIKIMAAFSQAV